MAIFSKIFSFEPDPLKTYAKELSAINGYKDEVAALSQEQMQAEVSGWKKELSALEDLKDIFQKLQDIRPRAFALVREASKRTNGQFHYDVQEIGGLVLA